VPGELTRILSDIHYGERSSRVHSLRQLLPLFEGATGLLLNGDTLDTRIGPNPEVTARTRGEVKAFFSDLGVPVKFVTGNHDPDLSPHHLADLADGRVFVTHGDILFAAIVPWGQDVALIGRLMKTALASLPDWQDLPIEERLRVIRQVTTAVPQRHQSEPHPLKYALRFAMDTVWPPTRIVKVLRAWREVPHHAAALLKKDRPGARFALIGHTHRPGVWRTPSGATIINTGAFCRPFGSFIVDLSPGRLVVRRVTARRGEYHPGEKVAEFNLET
jgi:predicted phosphodiesterase